MSYADLVTLLFACFTTAYAASVAQPAPADPPAVERAVITPPSDESPVVPPTPQAPIVAPEPTLRERLEPVLAEGLDDVEIEIIEDERGLVMSLPESATFSIGSADLTVAAQELLARIANTLQPTGARVRIEGHTDNTTIRGGRYRSNWELSTARASAVVAFMVSATGFEPARLSAAGYGEFHPRTSNDDAEGRARNRRVDVVVIDPRTTATEAKAVALP